MLLAHEALETLRAAEPDREVRCSIAADACVIGDHAMLSVAIANLVSNAWKCTKPVATPSIELGVFQSAAGERVFFVRDNGVGFDAEQAHRLFKPFARLHGESFEGSGIGLATVHRIVSRHRGRIWAESRPGEGTCMKFTLPG